MLFCPTFNYIKSLRSSSFLRLISARINCHEKIQKSNSFSDLTSLRLLKSKKTSAFGQHTFCKINDGYADDIVVCWTDGSCVNNGNDKTVAGIGVYFGDDHKDNVSASLGVGHHTNNRAEMFAIIKALKIALERGHRKVLIKTDSELIVKSMNDWLKIWKANKWRKVNNQPVKNLDLIQKIDSLCTQLDSVYFEHIKGTNNKHAHRLANQAMMKEKLAAIDS